MTSANPRFKATNEPPLAYAPGSQERRTLGIELSVQASQLNDIPIVIGGQRSTTRNVDRVTIPHNHQHVLAHSSQADGSHVQRAIDAAVRAGQDWSARTLAERSSVFLRAADLLTGSWRDRLNAATMLGQSKTVQQAEIDSACELIDFLRFNVEFAQDIEAQQPLSVAGVRNSVDYRPLEGFVYAVTPFNFTAIAGNLATAPVLMGNCVLWKPSNAALLSNYLFVELLEEAGLPPGVINFLPGDPLEITGAAIASPHLAGIHFTGSTRVFDELWLRTAENLRNYRTYPRLVGETGGKDFVVAHASANSDALAVALVRGAFEYQGQKCSAASRAYIPKSLWPRVKARMLHIVADLRVGDVQDMSNFMGAVIDRRAYDRLATAISMAHADGEVHVLTQARPDDSVGYFVPPTVVQVADPQHRLMQDELFGPLLAVYVYDDAAWRDILATVNNTSAYALTGAVFAQDEAAIAEASSLLRFSAGNFYLNDKPTGAVVGQQPFGGARRSGTNDKAGSAMNLLRWISARTVKNTESPPLEWRYPHMIEGAED